MLSRSESLFPLFFLIVATLVNALQVHQNLNVVPTPFGLARGSQSPNGGSRFAVKYASAKRWSHSTPAKIWELPNGSQDVRVVPLPCSQPGIAASNSSEDCLSMLLFVPPSRGRSRRIPTLLWIHGGSFVVGSASGPGLDGANLAAATNSIVAVVQYRLGALGFMAPDGKTNLAVKDVMSALTFLKDSLQSFGGDPSKITISGQSSGANLVRALLAVPSANSLFLSAIMQSDPMNYGFLSSATQKKLQTYFNSKIGCSSTDVACHRSLSLDAIFSAEIDLFVNAVTIDPSTGIQEPMRPVRDNSLITSPLDSTAPFPRVRKRVLITTVTHEAGLAIFSSFPNPLPKEAFPSVVNASLGTSRTQTVIQSSFYSVSDPNDVRPLVVEFVTDFIFRCPSWTFARNWAANGGEAFVGEFVVGATYPSSAGVPFCSEPGIVCHEGDIEIVFGTVPNPSPEQSAITTSIQKRYRSFLNDGDPNPTGLPQWKSVSGSNVHALSLGGGGEIAEGACNPDFYGQQVPYDYQIFNI